MPDSSRVQLLQKAWWVWGGSLLLGGCGICMARESALTRPLPCEPLAELRISGTVIRFDPGSEAGLQQLENEIERLLSAAARPQAGSGTASRLTAKDQRGLRVVARLARQTRQATNAEIRAAECLRVLEALTAVNNNQRPRVPAEVDLSLGPMLFAARLFPPPLHGSTPAKNLAGSTGQDPSCVDPLPSSFWQRPASIAQQDLFAGYGDRAPPALEELTWDYDGPKNGYGTSAGFELRSRGLKAKVKFVERHSEPFAARIFSAVGYHVEPTYHARALKVRYDRRLFLEFHSRKPVFMRFHLAGLDLARLDFQTRFDPFASFAGAVLRDGSRCSSHELKERLFIQPRAPHPESDPANFRPEMEAAIDYLVTLPANVHLKEPGVKSIGPWDFTRLGHPDRREVRAAGLVAAWLGWVDTRFDNTQVKYRQRGEDLELNHYFTDLGSCLGDTTGIFHWLGEKPNEFPWSFTRPPWPAVARGEMPKPFRIVGYRPLVLTRPFRALTHDDARWMTRLIGQLSEAQITQALVAAGYDSAEVRLYAEKLIHRRDRLVQDVGLGNEIPRLRPGGIDRGFSYDPNRSGPMVVVIRSGASIAAPVSEQRVVNGRLVQNPGAARTLAAAR